MLVEPLDVSSPTGRFDVSIGREIRVAQPGPDRVLGAGVGGPVLERGKRGPLRLSALASELTLDASTVSRHVRSLESAGLLERAADPEDGRAFQVALSPEGAARIEEAACRRRDLIGSLLADWSVQDREDMRRLLHQLTLSLQNQEHSA